MDNKYYLFIVLAFLSEILGTVSGFGSSILFVPIASLFFDFKEVLGITAVFHVFSNLSKIALFKKGIDKSIAIKLGIPAVAFVIIGAWLTSYLPVRRIEIVMSIVLVVMAIFLFVNRYKTLARTDGNLYIGGIVSGFLAGLVGTGGAIRGITLAAFHLSKDVFVATSALIDLGVDSSRAVVYIASGYFKKEFFFFIPILIIISFFGSYIGKLFLKRISENVFRNLVLAIIIATAVFQLIKQLGMQQ